MLRINGRLLCDYCLDEIETGVCPKRHPPVDAAPMALPTGSVLLGKYVVARTLGMGGFGITYLAWDNANSRRVAIKEYFPSSLSYRDGASSSTVTITAKSGDVFTAGMEKFYEEAQLIACFSGNASIIDVYEFFYENNTAYYVMEFLDGCDLKKYVADSGGRISEEQTLFIANRIAEALTVLHSAGVLHRDISPDNVFMCSDGRIKLIDFGASRQTLGEQSKSLSVILKQSFAPLEQYQRRGKQGSWTDYYALGATLYYCVTGHAPEDAASRLTYPELEYPPGVNITPVFKRLIDRLMNTDLTKRPQNARELVADILQTAYNPLGADMPYGRRETPPKQTAAGGTPPKYTATDMPYDRRETPRDGQEAYSGAGASYMPNSDNPAAKTIAMILLCVIAACGFAIIGGIGLCTAMGSQETTDFQVAEESRYGVLSGDEYIVQSADSPLTEFECDVQIFYTLADHTVPIGEPTTVATVTGEGSYTVSVRYEESAQGVEGFSLFLDMKSAESRLLCDFTIREIKINGKSIELCGRSYTSYQGGEPKYVYAYQPDSKTHIGTPFCANGSVEDCSNIIIDPADFKDINNIEVIFEVVRPQNGEYLVASGDLTYIIYPDSKNAEVFDCAENATYAGVKPTVCGYPVTGLGSAFYRCGNLTDVAIAEGISEIGSCAFYYCSNLTNVAIPDSVTSIGDYAFNSCTSLASVTIPDSVTSIGDYAFNCCSSLISVVIPDGVTSISYGMFLNCTSLTDVVIPDSVTSIDDNAFRWCEKLYGVVMSNNVTSIGEAAFSGCGCLTNFVMPDSVTTIGDYAFHGCKSITSIEIPDGVTSISNYTFINCAGLVNIEIPDSVTTIGEWAFLGCESLTSIVIPDSVTSIGNGAFNNCTSLTDVVVPDSVYIGYGAFYDTPVADRF